MGAALWLWIVFFHLLLKMSFLSLSNEVIFMIAKQVRSQNDLSSLVQVNRRLCFLLKHTLYRRNIRYHNGRGIL